MQVNGSAKSIICGMMALEPIFVKNTIPGTKRVLNFSAASIIPGIPALAVAIAKITIYFVEINV